MAAPSDDAESGITPNDPPPTNGAGSHVEPAASVTNGHNPALVVGTRPGHNGGGTLRSGGIQGAGPGLPPALIRERLRHSAERRIHVLESIIDGEPVERVRLADGSETKTKVSASASDRIKAWGELAKYGLGSEKQVNKTTRKLVVNVVRETRTLRRGG